MAVPTPNITLTGTFVDTQGNPVNGGTVTATLVNYGSNVPRLAGSAVLETLTTSVTMVANTFSMVLYGNDQISPSGTFYQLVFPGPGAFTTLKNYQLAGIGTFDLSNLVPFGTPLGPQSTPGQIPVSPLATVAHNFVTGLTTAGTLITAQPSTSDLATGTFAAADGSRTVPAYGFAGAAGLGIYRFPASNDMVIACSATNQALIAAGLWRFRNGQILNWSTNNDPTLATGDIGLWRSAANQLSTVTDELVTPTVGGKFQSGQFLTGDGTAPLPGYGFTSSGNGTGMYQIAANNLGFTINGTGRYQMLPNTFTGANGTVLGWNSSIINSAIDTGFSRLGAATVGVGNGTNGDTSGELRSAKIAATYNAAGTLQTAVHIVQDTVTLAAGTATVTLTGSAVFSSASSYTCVAMDNTGANAVKVTQTSGSSITFTGTSTDVIRYICIGN